MVDPTKEKAALRSVARARRQTFDPALGEQLAQIALTQLGLPPAATIAGVWPLPGELDLRPLLQALHASGHGILLPETTPPGQPLIFRHWTPGCAMVTERFGTQRPDGQIDSPDILFVPLLAFDRRGHRLGYGGGYYDRTLAALPGRAAIGFGFSALEVDFVPTGPHDQPLDAIVTEKEVIRVTDRV
jgi:5-formyltetrahydrofolate cyclo-ligase